MKAILLVPIFFLLIGCASPTPRELLSKIYSVPENEISTSTNDVIKKTNSEPIAGFISSKIEVTDPILLYGDRIKYRSNYKLYHFLAKENQKYRIEVTSYLKNGGIFDKFAMAPLVYLLDSDGNILDESLINIDVSSFITSSLTVKYEGVIKKTDKYFLLIGSDNRAAGVTFFNYLQDYFVSTGYGFVSGSAPIELNGYPIGSFDLKILLE